MNDEMMVGDNGTEAVRGQAETDVVPDGTVRRPDGRKTSLAAGDVVPDGTVRQNSDVSDRNVGNMQDGTRLEQKDKKRIVQAFQGDDPLMFIADDTDRQDVSRLTETMQNRDEYRKRMLLAAWFNLRSPKASYQFILGNLDLILKKYYNEKQPVNVDRAYNDIKEMYFPSVSAGKMMWDEAAASAKAGGANLLQTLSNVFFTFLQGAPGMSMAIMPDYDIQKQQSAEIRRTHRNVHTALEQYSGEETAKALPEDWISNPDQWLWNAGKFLMTQAPAQAMQYASAYLLGPWAFTAVMGGTSAMDKWYDLEYEDNSTMSAEQKMWNAGLTGLINSGFAWLTAGVVKGKLAEMPGFNRIPFLKEEQLASGVKGVIRYWCAATGVEAGQEFVEQLSENFVDIRTGKYGEPEKLSDAEFRKYLWQGVPESALAGGAFGGVSGAAGFRSVRQLTEAVEQTRRFHEKRLQELKGKENLSEAEKVKLQMSEAVLAAEKPMDQLTADWLVRQGEIALDDAEIRASEEFKKRMQEAPEGTTEEAVIESIRSEQKHNLMNGIQWSLETIADEVAEIAKQYRNIHFEVVENFDGLPESVKAEAKARGYEQSSVPGVWDPETDTVYINAEKAQPTNLEAIIFHEVVGHKGLHEVIPQGQWDGFLDAVYSRHFNDDDFKAVVRNYKLGKEVTKTDEESGIPYQERSVDDVEEQRYAAEEYLAHTAESGVKPGWWRETVAGVRTLLRRFFPNMHFTDNDIASALMRSARAMRKRRGAFAGMRYERGGMRYGGAEGTGADTRTGGEVGQIGRVGQSGGIKFKLCEFEDHKRFVDVQTDQHLFDGLSEKESVDLARKIIHDRFSGRVIGIDNPVYVNGVGAGEYSHPAKPIEDGTVKTAKMKASAELDNLVDAGNSLPDEPDGRDGHMHEGTVSGFSYLKTIFKVGNEFYEGIVNIINNQKGKLFKDVTQIKNITKAIAVSYGKNPKYAFLRDVSMRDNVPPSSEMSTGEAKKTGKSRFMMMDYPEEVRRDILNIIKPFVGIFPNEKTASDYQKLLADHGVKVSEQEAQDFAMEAIIENNREARKRAVEKRDAWLFENVPFWHEAVEYASNKTDFRIVPGEKFQGEAFTGTFIAEEYRKYSEKRAQQKDESAEEYTKYLQKREKALKKAKGISLDELSEVIARKTNRDQLDVEHDLLEFFRDMKKPDLYRIYSDWRENEYAADREAAEALRKEWEAQEKFQIEDDVLDVLSAGKPVDEEWIMDHRKVFRELYQKIFGKEAPEKIGKADFEALNAALIQNGSEAETYAKAYKDARKKSWEEYQKALKDIKAELRKDMADAGTLQRKASAFARGHLKPEDRGFFIKGIVDLLKYGTRQSVKYPEGQRMMKFQELLEGMTQKSQDSRRNEAIRKIKELLKKNRSKRTDKNVPYSPMGDHQVMLDRINQIVSMRPETAIGVMQYLLEMKAKASEEGEVLSDEAKTLTGKSLKEINEDIALFHNFGFLEYKTAEAAEESLRELKKVVREGREWFRDKIDRETAHIEEERLEIIREMNQGAGEISGERALDKTVNPAADFVYMNMSIIRMLDIFSRKSDLVSLDKSHAGKLIAKIESSTQKEQTNLNRLQKVFDTLLKEKAGVKSLIEKGRFLNRATEERKTGIMMPEYGIMIGPEDKKIIRWGRKPVVKLYMDVDHCRAMLEDINLGKEQVESVIPIKDRKERQVVRDEIWEWIRAHRSEVTGKGEAAVGKRFSMCLLGSGKIRVYTEQKNGEILRLDVSPEDMPFTKQYVMPDARPVSDLMKRGAEDQIMEYDAGGDISLRDEFRDEIDAAAMKKFKEDMTTQVTLYSEAESEIQRDFELELSPGAAVELVLEWEQDHYKPNMMWNGYTQEKIDQIKAWVDKINPAYMKMGYALRDFLKETNGELDAAVFDRYGVHLPEIPNFWYADFSGTSMDKIQDAGFGNMAGGMTVNATFLTARRFHLKPVDTKSNAFQLFLRKQLEQTHFIAWTKTIKELRAIYGNKNVQNALKEQFGEAAWKNLKNKIEMLASGGTTADRAAKFFSYMFKSWVPANVALNMSSMLKQLAGGVQYALYADAGDLVKHLPEAGQDNAHWLKWMRSANMSEYIRNRLAGGMDPNLLHMLNYTRNAGKVSPTSDMVLKGITIGTLKADQLSALTWGYAAWQSFRKKALLQGMSEKEAEDFAWRMWQRATDETQQSGYLKDANYFTANQGLWRYLTMYMTNPMQTAALEISSYMKYAKDKNKANFNAMMKRVIINHIVTTTVMNLISSAMRHGLNIGDYADDWPDYVAGWMLGSFDSIFMFGKMASALLGALFGEHVYGSEFDALPMITDLSKDVERLHRPDNMDLLDYMKVTGDVMMSGGPVQSRTLGMLLYTIARQGKRLQKWMRTEKKGQRYRESRK